MNTLTNLKYLPIIILSLAIGEAQALNNKPDRVFTEKDVSWDKNTKPYKSIIIKGINKVYRENDRCLSLHPGTVDVSLNKGTKADPVFYVMCEDSTKIPFNVFFSKSEIVNEKNLSAAQHINQETAIKECKDAIRIRLNHPRTAKFPLFSTSVTEYPNGRTRVTTSFTTRNSFNLELKYNASCLMDITNMFDVHMSETIE